MRRLPSVTTALVLALALVGSVSCGTSGTRSPRVARAANSVRANRFARGQVTSASATRPRLLAANARQATPARGHLTARARGVVSTSPWFWLVRANSRACLDDTGLSHALANRMQMYQCLTGDNAQLWRQVTGTTSNGKYVVYLLQNLASMQCLDDYGFGLTNGSPAVQWPCSVDDVAEWLTFYQGSQRGLLVLQLRGQHVCLDDPGQNASNGVKLWYWGCNNTIAQVWVPQYPAPLARDRGNGAKGSSPVKSRGPVPIRTSSTRLPTTPRGAATKNATATTP